MLFLGASLIVAIVEFCVLLSIVLSCTRLSKRGSASQVLDPVVSAGGTLKSVSGKELAKTLEANNENKSKDDLSDCGELTREPSASVQPNNTSSNNSTVIKRHKVENRSVSPVEPSDIDEETYIETLRMLNERQKTIYQSQRSSKPDLETAGVKETFTQTQEFFQNNKNQNNHKRLKNLHQNVATIQAEIKDMQSSSDAYQNNPLRTSKIHNKRQKNYFQLQSMQSLPVDNQPEVKKTFSQPTDLFQTKHETPFRNFRSSRISRSYLV